MITVLVEFVSLTDHSQSPIDSESIKAPLLLPWPPLAAVLEHYAHSEQAGPKLLDVEGRESSHHKWFACKGAAG
jgi:hypothetical protein